MGVRLRIEEPRRLLMWPSIDALPNPTQCRLACHCACRELPVFLRWALEFCDEPLQDILLRWLKTARKRIHQQIKNHLADIEAYDSAYDHYTDDDDVFTGFGHGQN